MRPDHAPLIIAPASAIAPLAVGARDAARLLGGISESALYRLTAPRGPIPVAKCNGRVLYRVGALEEFLREQEQRTRCGDHAAPGKLNEPTPSYEPK